MNAVIRSFRRSFQLKFLLGMCPFETDFSSQRVYLSSRSLIYTISYAIIHLMTYLILSFLRRHETDESNTTRNIVRLVVNLVPGTAFILMLALSIKHRRRHVLLINCLDKICRRMYATARSPKVKSYSKLHLRNLLVFICIFGCPILDMMFYYEKPTFLAKANYIHFIVVFTHIMVAMLHSQDIATVLVDAIECLINGDNLTENVHAIADLCNMTYCYQKCFGSQLLISTMIDLLLITVTWFFLCVQIAFVQGDRFFEECFRVIVYIVTIFGKNWLVVGVIDRLENLVENVDMELITKFRALHSAYATDPPWQLCVCKYTHLKTVLSNIRYFKSIQSDLLWNRVLHMKRKKRITANGFFPVNLEMLFKVTLMLLLPRKHCHRLNNFIFRWPQRSQLIC